MCRNIFRPRRHGRLEQWQGQPAQFAAIVWMGAAHTHQGYSQVAGAILVIRSQVTLMKVHIGASPGGNGDGGREAPSVSGLRRIR